MHFTSWWWGLLYGHLLGQVSDCHYALFVFFGFEFSLMGLELLQRFRVGCGVGSVNPPR